MWQSVRLTAVFRDQSFVQRGSFSFSYRVAFSWTTCWDLKKGFFKLGLESEHSETGHRAKTDRSATDEDLFYRSRKCVGLTEPNAGNWCTVVLWFREFAAQCARRRMDNIAVCFQFAYMNAGDNAVLISEEQDCCPARGYLLRNLTQDSISEITRFMHWHKHIHITACWTSSVCQIRY